MTRPIIFPGTTFAESTGTETWQLTTSKPILQQKVVCLYESDEIDSMNTWARPTDRIISHLNSNHIWRKRHTCIGSYVYPIAGVRPSPRMVVIPKLVNGNVLQGLPLIINVGRPNKPSRRTARWVVRR